MKKLTVRFILYFSIGLMLFLIYLLTMSSFLLRLFSPVSIQQFVFVVDSTAAMVQHILILLFCFVTGGALFSVFLVYPQAYIMNTVRGLSNGDFYAVGAKAVRKNGKIKLPYFLYQGIILNIVKVGEELEKAQRERAQLDKAKNEWIAGVSHDLKTPLAYVTGYSSLILNNKYEWTMEEALPCIEEIYNKGMQQEKLIEDLNLTFFLDNLEASMLRVSQTDLISLLRNIMVDMANDLKGQDYGFTFDSEIETLNMMIDASLMTRAFYNLLTNAVSHNPKGTEITMKVSRKDGQILIELADNGVGLDEDTLQNMFERYYSRTENASLHKGLGLSIVKQIMTVHSAAIDVESAAGKGTKFHITLPHTA